MIKIAINGFGRIGRSAFKVALMNKNLKVVAINDLGNIDNMAYLLKHDSVYGRFEKDVQVRGKNLLVDRKEFPVYSIADPGKLPWKKLKVDVVLECTGVFTRKEDAEKHLSSGAGKVIISAPTKSEGVLTVVRGVNDKLAKGEKIIANASCTTNCIAPVMAVLEKEFGVEKSFLTTVHSSTASQRVVDLPDAKDWRRGRAAGVNIIPSTTGAAVAASLVLPSLADNFDGIAFRVPIVCGSIVDAVALLKKNVTVKQVNNAFKKAAQRGALKGILEASEEELVSSDVIKTTASAIVDLKFTRVVGGNLVKIIAWYDNEWAYCLRLVEMCERV
ncbi:type I glyceraldehyde-3-phosphate dehydrogenase [Patescibacteria group bacterium]|nr:type I glyceraldehyde-3-phosphate dehydrogenase [Patescibacteria group bacterium]